MGIFIMIAIPIALLILSLLIPIIAKIFIYMDYAFLVLLIWAFIFGASGQNSQALFYNSDMHLALVISIYLGIISIWFGLQQIRIMRIYIFKIIACALAAFIIITFASTGWFGETVANGMTIMWQIIIGIAYFLVAIFVRINNNNLMKPA
jgi:hypothetical protein